jgi:ABC-2 type transport system ATP-binding protein
MLSIKEQLNQPVRKLSLGQRMKAELLAALLHHPKFYF